MPSGLLIRLRPAGPWRIGPDSGDRDRVERVYHSDTLYSAVTSAMARLGMLEEWLEHTARAAEPAVRFSSCFPFHGDALYVTPPRSLWPPPASSKVRWKGARFVPLSAIQSLLRGKPVSEEGWSVDGASETLIAMGTQGPFRVSVRSSAAVDRYGSAVTTHSSACLEFAPNAGLWLTVAFSNEEAREKWKGPVTAALRLLGDSGFGGERSRGWGRAEVEVSDRNRPLVDAPADQAESGWWILSLYHPAPGDAVDWTRGHYAVTTRTGRIESEAGWGGAKRAARMITEGSVVMAASEPRGSIIDAAPEGFPHPVYRAGYALAIAIPLRPVVRELPREAAPALELPRIAPLEPASSAPAQEEPPAEEERPAAEQAPTEEASPLEEPLPAEERAPTEESPAEPSTATIEPAVEERGSEPA